MSEIAHTPLNSNNHRLLVVRNPNATNADVADKNVDDLRENSLFTPEIIEEAHPAAAAEKLQNEVREGDIVYVLSGDGGLRLAANVLGNPELPRAVLLASDIGNAKNFYRATIGAKYAGQPSKILRSGTIRDVFPLRGRIVHEDEEFVSLGLSIISVGAIATGTAMLEEHRYDRLRRHKNPTVKLAYETVLSVCCGLPRTRTLEIADPDGGNVRSALDVITANAPTIGKVANFDTRVDHHNFVHGTIRSQLRAPAGIIGLLRGTFPTTHIEENAQTLSFMLTQSSKNRRALSEFDGDVVSVAPGSTVTIDQPGYEDATHRPIPALFAQ